MRHLKIERLKTVLIIFLMFLSFVQIGFHWNQQAQGFPSRFFAGFFSMFMPKKLPVNIEAVKSSYFVPESIVTSISTTQWLIHEGDQYYDRIWNDVKNNYIPAILKQKPIKLPKEQFDNILDDRCTRINFGVTWPKSILLWFENMQANDAVNINAIRSIALLPEKNVNASVNIVYVLDDQATYEYHINLNESFVKKSFYEKLADQLSDKPSAWDMRFLHKAYPVFKTNNNQPTQPLGEGRGYGRKTLSEICTQNNVSIDIALSNLRSHGIEASQNEKLKDIATRYNLLPIDVANKALGIKKESE